MCILLFFGLAAVCFNVGRKIKSIVLYAGTFFFASLAILLSVVMANAAMRGDGKSAESLATAPNRGGAKDPSLIGSDQKNTRDTEWEKLATEDEGALARTGEITKGRILNELLSRNSNPKTLALGLGGDAVFKFRLACYKDELKAEGKILFGDLPELDERKFMDSSYYNSCNGSIYTKEMAFCDLIREPNVNYSAVYPELGGSIFKYFSKLKADQLNNPMYVAGPGIWGSAHNGKEVSKGIFKPTHADGSIFEMIVRYCPVEWIEMARRNGGCFEKMTYKVPFYHITRRTDAFMLIESGEVMAGLLGNHSFLETGDLLGRLLALKKCGAEVTDNTMKGFGKNIGYGQSIRLAQINEGSLYALTPWQFQRDANKRVFSWLMDNGSVSKVNAFFDFDYNLEAEIAMAGEYQLLEELANRKYPISRIIAKPLPEDLPGVIESLEKKIASCDRMKREIDGMTQGRYEMIKFIKTRKLLVQLRDGTGQAPAHKPVDL